MEFNIRKATFKDLPSMLSIMDSALETATPSEEIDENLQLWESKLKNESDWMIFVVEIVENEKLIGWCRGGRTVEVHRLVNNENYECEIHNIFILPEFQRRGIGRKLWKKMFDEIMERYHPKNFVIWSVEKEESQQFYRSLGGQAREQKRFRVDALSTAFTWQCE